MMEDENQNMMTPLLDDEEHSVTTPVAEEAISLTEGTTPQSKMSSGLSQRQKQQILSVPKNPSSTGRVEHEEEESKTSQTRHELGSADMCLVLVYAQWIWPSMVNSGFVFAHYADDEERWFASMIGNALFFACLWWIKTGNSTKTVPAEETSFAEDEKKKSARGGPQQQQQQQQSVNDNYGSATIRKKQNREDELLMWNNANENSLPSLTTSVIPIINEVNANSGGGDDVGSRSSSTSWKESLASKIVASSSKLEHRNRQQPQPQPQPQQ
mmetsp:Transcript_20564/g.32366  ORF Transcript_20564/g.32366 Transcript_20564/m.32366 type:complete len:270 (+) Transcript_20564:144-953(+)